MAFLGRFLSQNLVFEILIFAIICFLLWMVTQVQPNGELSNAGYDASTILQDLESYLLGFSADSESQGLGLVQPRSRYETYMYSGFCGMASFASVYVNNSSALSYFVLIPAFLIIIFAYNKTGPESFSRPSRVIFSIIIILMIFIVTFKVIQIQEIQATIVSLTGAEFFAEDYNFHCEAQLIELDGETSTAHLSLFLGNLSAFLSEIRIYLLGLVLWIIGKEHADIRKIQKAATAQPGQGLGGNDDAL